MHVVLKMILDGTLKLPGSFDTTRVQAVRGRPAHFVSGTGRVVDRAAASSSRSGQELSDQSNFQLTQQVLTTINLHAGAASGSRGDRRVGMGDSITAHSRNAPFRGQRSSKGSALARASKKKGKGLFKTPSSGRKQKGLGPGAPLRRVRREASKHQSTKTAREAPKTDSVRAARVAGRISRSSQQEPRASASRRNSIPSGPPAKSATTQESLHKRTRSQPPAGESVPWEPRGADFLLHSTTSANKVSLLAPPWASQKQVRSPPQQPLIYWGPLSSCQNDLRRPVNLTSGMLARVNLSSCSC